MLQSPQRKLIARSWLLGGQPGFTKFLGEINFPKQVVQVDEVRQTSLPSCDFRLPSCPSCEIGQNSPKIGWKACQVVIFRCQVIQVLNFRYQVDQVVQNTTWQCAKLSRQNPLRINPQKQPAPLTIFFEARHEGRTPFLRCTVKPRPRSKRQNREKLWCKSCNRQNVDSISWDQDLV